MATPTEIRDKIIEAIDAFDFPSFDHGAFLATSKWFKGEPPRSRYPAYPWGWVEWSGGAMEPPVGNKAEIRDVFLIVLVDKHVNAEVAENSIMDFVLAIECALDDDPTFGGTVARSYVTNREKQKVFEGDYSIVAARITLMTHRRQ